MSFDAYVYIYAYTYITQLMIIGDVDCETLYNIALILDQSVITGDGCTAKYCTYVHTYIYMHT